MAKKRKISAEDAALASRLHLMGLNPNEPNVNAGSETYMGIGMQIPLLLQYLFDVRGLPLGLVFQLIGDRGSRKTTFAFELIRQVGALGGNAFFALTEGKYSHSLQHALCGYVDEADSVLVRPYKSSSMSDWHTYISDKVKRCNTMMDKGFKGADGISYPPAYYAPTAFVVDSLVAQLTQNQADTVEEQGGAERGYATHVKALSEWLSQIQAAIAGRPYVMALINHCDINVKTQWDIEIKEKGGRKLAYESSLIIFMGCSAPQLSTLILDGWGLEQSRSVVTLSLNKSSLGADSRKIRVPILERHQYHAAGEMRQRSWFMWGEGLVNLMMSRMYKSYEEIRFKGGIDTAGASAKAREMVNDVVQFQPVPGKKDVYTCDKYGEKGQMYTAQELGERLTTDIEFVRVFHELFAIKKYDVWPKGTDYNEFIAKARERLYGGRTMIPKKKG